MSQQCCEMVYSGGYSTNRYLCSVNATRQRNGKWYCGIHDPIQKEARDKARKEKWDAECKAKRDGWVREKRRAEAGEMAIDMCKWMLENNPSAVNHSYLWERAQAVIEKLEGK